MIWSRIPWHFDHNLIILEKPKGAGDISKLSFRMVDFWLQIHNIPLMCMNRHMAKYLAEQLGTAVELPANSRECMGRFIRVKVRIDISKPLMRCLRLNVDDSGEITTAILLYERLPEFCYAYGIIGHGLSDCPNDDARLEALEGIFTKYGHWLRAASDEGTKHPTMAQIVNIQAVRGPESVMGRDMEMIDSENVNPHVQGTQIDSSENEGNSSKAASQKLKEGSQADGKLDVRDSYRSEFDGGRKRKISLISPQDSPEAKKKKEGMGNLRTFSALKRAVHKYSPVLLFLCYVDAHIKMEDGFLWRFSDFYGNPNPSLRKTSWDLLRRLKEIDNLPWVCGGDFYELLCLNEKL
ncbi:hypothetical protein EZV62_024376 [Acer yangbiense]|uniref:Zinc knuckle CX2CX4HX4C domain-containing protein n=1 Tax=Acer yangbiense TaxID=1000413 RepID=A0A5C7GUT9_9ROSI|nr:hypothetical protein EZV62_024376 [Acer yangbiense]